MEILGLVLALLLGMLTGVFTGFLPGLHVNVVAALVAGGSAGLMAGGVPASVLAVYVVTVAITHAFCEIVPTLFLGIPADEAYSLLPGHQLVRDGRGLEAMALCLFGCLRGLQWGAGLVLGLLLMEWFGWNPVDGAHDLLRAGMAWILAVISLILIASDRRPGWALLVFGLSGLFGLITFHTPLIQGGTHSAFGSLFPALTGLFGMSGLVLALGEKTRLVPEQSERLDPIELPEKAAVLGAGGGILVGLLPGLGAGNMAACFSLGKKESHPEESSRKYLVTTGAINTGDALFGILALYLIDRARSGASVALEAFLPELKTSLVVTLMIAALVAGHLLYFGLRHSGFRLARAVNHLDAYRLNLATMVFLIILVLATTGFWGLLFLAAGTSLGLIAPSAGVRRAQAMGLFLVPTSLFFAGWTAPVVSTLGLEAVNLPAPEVGLLELGLKLLFSVVAGAAAYRSVAARPAGSRPGEGRVGRP